MQLICILLINLVVAQLAAVEEGGDGLVRNVRLHLELLDSLPLVEALNVLLQSKVGVLASSLIGQAITAAKRLRVAIHALRFVEHSMSGASVPYSDQYHL